MKQIIVDILPELITLIVVLGLIIGIPCFIIWFAIFCWKKIK